MPNAFAWLALAGWPLVVLVFYAARQSSARVARTTAWMMVLPVMFLPSQLVLKTSGIPYLDKNRLSFLSIALALQLFHRREILGAAPKHNFPRWALLALVFGTVVTVHGNGEALAFGPKVLPGLRLYDVLSISGALVLDFYLPFAVGQRVFRTERGLRDLLEVLSICGLIYAPLCLLELRLSPQLHFWVYGYYPSQFLQAVREGAFRPIVFMNHGLSVAMFWFTCLCAAVALRKVRARGGPGSPTARAAVAGVFILLCKSLASIIYSGCSLIVHLAFSSKTTGRILTLLLVLIIAYPTARITRILPTQEVVEFFAGINPDRAESLLFRFRNEDSLIERAKERPVFGWGTFGRNRIYDPDSGKDLSVTDGAWIIQFGQFGYVGLAAFASLLLVPVFRFTRSRARMRATSQALLGVLAFIVVVFTIDLFPNSASDALPFAYAGALFTLAGNTGRRVAHREITAQPDTTASGSTASGVLRDRAS